MKIFSTIKITLFVICFSTNVLASTTINVLTLNTWMIPIQGKKAKTRAKIIGKNISEFDLVFLQEAFTRKVRKTIRNNTTLKFTDLYIYQRGNILGSGLYNFSKFQITKKDFMPFKSCRNIQCASDKGVLYMQVKLPNGIFIDTFSTHLQAYQKDAKVRIKQLIEAKAFIDELSDGTLPALFVGDFNTIASTDEYSSLSKFLIGYHDVWLDYRPSDNGYTWNPDINSWANDDEEESVQKQRIDYIFVKDGKSLKWTVKEAEVVFNDLYSYGSESLFVSDHFGLYSKLELSN